MTADHQRFCPECGKPIANPGPHGLCVQCLVRSAVAAADPTGAEEERTSVGKESAPSLEPGTGQLGRRFADYELLEEIARGGMGVVYRARQISLKRTVALKMILAGQFSTKEFIQRFRSEAAAAAMLQHPNIVAIHEVGVFEGQHFFSMDYVPGPNLSEVVRAQGVAVRQAARYVQQIARAIHYAHEQGILHRDLKPSNVLIDATTDQPRITDFGLAKRFALSPEAGTQISDLTVTGQVLGSPNYMPPEQASGDRGRLGRYTDVYSLGAILYHLLTGRPPFQGNTLEDVLLDVLRRDPVSPRLLTPSVPADLETICLKCLEKEPAKRYATAAALADDLERFLADEPIAARPVTRTERIWRWCRRNPVTAALSGSVLAALLLGFAGVLWEWQIARENARAEARARAEAQRLLTNSRRDLYSAEMKLASQAWEEGLVEQTRRLLDAHRPKPGEPDLRGFEWRCLWRLAQESDAATTLPGVAQPITADPDSRMYRVDDVLYSGGNAGWKGWQVGTWKELPGYLPGVDRGWWEPSMKMAFELTPDGTSLIVKELPFLERRAALPVSGEYLGPIKVSSDRQTLAFAEKHAAERWVVVADLAHNEVIQRVQTGAVSGAGFDLSPDGRALVVVRDDGRAEVWDLKTSVRIPFTPDKPYPVGAAQFAAGGDALILWDTVRDNVFWIWPWRTEEPAVMLEQAGALVGQALSPDGLLYATTTWDGMVTLWSIAQRQAVWHFQAHQDRVIALAFSPDGRRLATGGVDQTVRLWDVSRQEAVAEFRGHNEEVFSVQFTADGKTLLSFSAEGAVKVWDIDAGQKANRFKGHHDFIRSIAVSPDGRMLATGGDFGLLKLWDSVTRTETKGPSVGQEVVQAVAFSPKTNLLAWLSNTTLGILELATGRSWQFPFEQHANGVQQLRFTPDGNELAFGNNQRVLLFDVAAQRLHTFATSTGVVLTVGYSPDGRRLAAGDEGGWLDVWDRGSGRRLVHLRAYDSWARNVAFSPDGQLIATCGWDGFLKLWQWRGEDLTLKSTGSRQTGALVGLCFSPDGTRLFTGGRGGKVTIWGIEPLVELAAFRHSGSAVSLAVAPDGNALYSAGWGPDVRVWPAASFAEADAPPLSPPVH